MMDTHKINYSDFKEELFLNRYISPIKLHKYIEEVYKKESILIGKSTLGLPIYKVIVGNGSKKVLAWTQMHGNESTATLAGLDIIKFLKSDNEIAKHILNNIELHIIFMLNPDGSKLWQRRNAVEIDINRDYIKESSVEVKLLKKEISNNKYDWALNLHDQRSIFNLENTKTPSTIALLAPSFDVNRSESESRIAAMNAINYIVTNVNSKNDYKTARFSDEYYPRSCGDNIQGLAIPTILIEAGHYKDDYNRTIVRECFFEVWFNLLYYICKQEKGLLNHKDYYNIPMNATDFYDILIRDIKLKKNNNIHSLDISMQFKEIVNPDETIHFIPLIEEIGDLSHKYGWQEITDSDKVIDADQFTIRIGESGEDLLNHLQFINI